jgi:hypothetical protein
LAQIALAILFLWKGSATLSHCYDAVHGELYLADKATRPPPSFTALAAPSFWHDFNIHICVYAGI